MAGWEEEAEQQRRRADEAERLLKAERALCAKAAQEVVSLTATVKARDATIKDLHNKLEDEPLTSWGDLRAQSTGWRAAFLEAVTSMSLDGLSPLEWRRRALHYKGLLETLVGGAQKGMAQVSIPEKAFLPSVMSPRLLELGRKLKEEVAREELKKAKERVPRKLDSYDGFELHPCILVSISEAGTPVLEPCDEKGTPADKIHCWCVYGHLPAGGIEDIADFRVKHLAEHYFSTLEQALAARKAI